MSNFGYVKTAKGGSRTNRARAISSERRCSACAGFGTVYRTNRTETEIRRLPCGSCNGTGKLQVQRGAERGS